MGAPLDDKFRLEFSRTSVIKYQARILGPLIVAECFNLPLPDILEIAKADDPLRRMRIAEPNQRSANQSNYAKFSLKNIASPRDKVERVEFTTSLCAPVP